MCAHTNFAVDLSPGKWAVHKVPQVDIFALEGAISNVKIPNFDIGWLIWNHISNQLIGWRLSLELVYFFCIPMKQ